MSKVIAMSQPARDETPEEVLRDLIAQYNLDAVDIALIKWAAAELTDELLREYPNGLPPGF